MKIDDEVAQMLDRCTTSGTQLRMPQMSAALYRRVNKVLEAAGGKWNRKAGAHLFDGDAAEAIEPILLSGAVLLIKQEFGCFFTPPAICDLVLAKARIAPGMHVIEPSAGHGALAARAAAAGATVDCYELLGQNCAVLRGLALPGTVHQGDFLAATPSPLADRIVMNPPFAKSADAQHVLHALGFLKPGGLLTSIMASSITFRSTALYTRLRELIHDAGGTVDALPPDAFKSSGTDVRTVLVTIPARC